MAAWGRAGRNELNPVTERGTPWASGAPDTGSGCQVRYPYASWFPSGAGLRPQWEDMLLSYPSDPLEDQATDHGLILCRLPPASKVHSCLCRGDCSRMLSIPEHRFAHLQHPLNTPPAHWTWWELVASGALLGLLGDRLPTPCEREASSETTVLLPADFTV